VFLTVLCLSLAKAIRDGEITRLMLRSLVLMLVENIVAKAIRDGAIKAKIDHANGWLIYRRRLETFTLQERGSNPPETSSREVVWIQIEPQPPSSQSGLYN
jgi:26S proteasome regulatory subunit N3